MSFALARLAELAAAGPVARVVVAETKGSVPREVGAAMLVTDTGVEGTIGGGALEFAAIARARSALADGRDRLDRQPLGPALGQCCGGAVAVLTEIWDAARVGRVAGDIVVRPLPGEASAMPLCVRHLLARARSEGRQPSPGVVDGWMIEPVARPEREIWVWGAGHVGRALVGVLAPLPGLSIFWADSDRSRFPDAVPAGVEVAISTNPADLVTLSGPFAEHFVLTYSHALDLEICHRILGRPFRWLGLIGSATKRARFRSRLAALGHGAAQIDRIDCPIGDPALGKHPQAIAVGVAAGVITRRTGGTKMIGESA